MNPNTFYVLSDRAGFAQACGPNSLMIEIFDKIGPFKPVIFSTGTREVIKKFVLEDGSIFDNDAAIRQFAYPYSFHILENEFKYFMPVESKTEFKFEEIEAPVKRHKPSAIPEIHITITNKEELRSVIVMLQGLENAVV